MVGLGFSSSKSRWLTLPFQTLVTSVRKEFYLWAREKDKRLLPSPPTISRIKPATTSAHSLALTEVVHSTSQSKDCSGNNSSWLNNRIRLTCLPLMSGMTTSIPSTLGSSNTVPTRTTKISEMDWFSLTGIASKAESLTGQRMPPP